MSKNNINKRSFPRQPRYYHIHISIKQLLTALNNIQSHHIRTDNIIIYPNYYTIKSNHERSSENLARFVDPQAQIEL